MSDESRDAAALRLAAIVESSDDAIVSKDLNGIIQSWNRGAERMFGYSADEAIGRSIRIVIPADRQSEEDEVLERIRRGEPVQHFETIRQRKDGSILPVSLSISPVRNVNGEVTGASKIARDITDRRQLDEVLSSAKASQDDLQVRLMSIAAASRTLLVSPRVEDVLPATLTLAAQMITADGHAVWQLLDGAWRIVASRGLSELFASTLVSSALGEVPPAVPFADPVVAEDVDDLPMINARRESYTSEGIKSILAVPLTIRDRSTGSLVFYYRRRHRFTEVETQVALALGNLASAALTTAELYDTERRFRRQSDFLAEAGAVLAKSLDYHATLTRVANLAVPQIADWCVVDLVGDHDSIERLAVAHVDPTRVELARRFEEQYPEDRNSRFGVRRTIRPASRA